MEMNRLVMTNPRCFLPWATAAALLCLGCAALQSQTDVAPAAVMISLDEAIRRAQQNQPDYAAAAANSQLAHIDRTMAHMAPLPTVLFHNQALYTQPLGATTSPRFIANNAVHEYTSQGMVATTLGLGQVADIRRATAADLRAATELEIARRGLVSAVSGLYFGLIDAGHRAHIAEQAHNEAADFLSLTQKREEAREAAHADVVKAQLEDQQRARELEDAQLTAMNARLELGVLLFPDPRTAYTVDEAEESAPLSSRDEYAQAAAANNPELKSALAALRESDAGVLSARADYLPTIGLNYNYGIDAEQFAVNGPDNVRNLGYSASVTVDLPVWNWLGTQHKIKQSEIRRNAARVALTAAQRQTIAQFEKVYGEAVAARHQLDSLDASEQTAAESLRLTKMRYTGGEATVLEVVDAQTAYVSAANAREDGRVRYASALTNLKTLTGAM
jgi:outer membrane protein TolC